MRLSFEEIQSEIKRVFVKYGMTEEKADICARIHTESTYDGIYSHGTNRVARFVDYIQRGWVDINADPTIEKDLGAVKVINGNIITGTKAPVILTSRSDDFETKVNSLALGAVVAEKLKNN